MLIKGLVAGAALCLLAGAVDAQDVFYWPAPAAATAPARMRSFPAGTPIAVAARSDISTKDVKPGDRIYLRVAEDLIYEGQTVVPMGAPVVGEVMRSDPSGYLGKKGKLAINLLYVQTPSGPVGLDGESSREGKSGTAASVATILLVGWPGVLIHGTSATIPYGSTVQAYLAQPLRFMAAEHPPVAPGAAPQAVAYLTPAG